MMKVKSLEAGTERKDAPPASVFITEPYRIFFPLGILAALFGSGYWMFVYPGVLPYAPLLHGLVQIELFGGAFAIGFLMTALPRFSRTESAHLVEVVVALLLYLATAALLFFSDTKTSQLFFILLLLWSLVFGVRRFRVRGVNPPPTFALVAIGFVHALCGALFILYPLQRFPLLGEKMIEQGFLLSLILGVGGFLAPRLMGLVDTSQGLVSFSKAVSPQKPWHQNPLIISLLSGVLLFLSFWLETAGLVRGGMIARACIATFYLWYFGVLSKPKSKSLVAILVSCALWLMLVGLWLAPSMYLDPVGALHCTYIGGFGLLMLAIGAQVTSSHGGVGDFWSKEKPSMIFLLIFVFSALLVRVSALHFPQYYLLLLAIAALLFVLALCVWAVKLFPIICRKK